MEEHLFGRRWLLLLGGVMLSACVAPVRAPTETRPAAAPAAPAASAPPAAQAVPGTSTDAFYADPRSIGYEPPGDKGGTLNYPLPNSIPNLNPFGPNNRIHPFFDAAYDQLLARRMGPGVGLLAAPVICRLCESWEVQADKKTYHFKLRQNVKWHDGEAFTAEDVKFSYEKAADPQTAFELRSNLAGIASIEVVDRHTVRIVTREPDADLLVKLASPIPIVPKHAYDAGVDMTKTVIGTGPFKHGSWNPDVEYVAVKSTDFWLPDRPLLDRLVGRLIPDVSTRAAAFLGKQIDVIAVGNIIQMEQLQRVAPDIKAEPHPDINAEGFIVNVQKSPFNDKRVRQAIHLAIDREAMNAQLHRGLGVKYLAPSTPPDWQPMTLTQEELAKMPGFRRPKDQDIADAKRLLTDAGYAEGLKVTASFPRETTGTPEAVEAAAAMMGKVGIDATIEPLDRATADKKRNDCAGDLVATTLGGPLSSVSRNYARYVTGGGENYCKYSNPEIDRLMAEQAREFDEKKRWEIIKKVQIILLDELPTIPLIARAPFQVWHPYVHNWRNYGSAVAFVWFPTAELIWVDRR